jgi:antitoxin (DNA-binding transcriptional repressor) of toxin-antitoxin stability system
MTYMSITEFNRNISEALARVEKGEEISITRRGKPIAVVHKPERVATAAERAKVVEHLRAIFEKGLQFDGPATYDERTGR